MNDALFVDSLDPLDHLWSDQKNRFQVKFPTARLEQILDRWPKHIHDHDMEVLIRDGAVRSNIVKSWYECCSKNRQKFKVWRSNTIKGYEKEMEDNWAL